MRYALAAAILLGLLPAHRASAQAPEYDAAPFVATLRAPERARIAAAVGRAPNTLPRYELALELADDLATFTLEETLTVTNAEASPWGQLVLRVFANATAPAGERRVSLAGGECLDGVPCTFAEEGTSAIVVTPARPLAPGQRLRIRLQLRGAMMAIDPSRTTMMGQGVEGLGALGGGHGAGDYGLLATSDGVASMSSFFAVLARRRGTVWEQSDASTMGDLGTDALCHVEARIRAARGVHLVATGVEEAPTVVGSRAETLVRAGFVRDFALVASARLASETRRVGGVAVRSFYIADAQGQPRGADAVARRASARTVLAAAAASMRIFSRRFGAYPYPELDVVEAPLVGGAGGVEFSSMVTVATMFYRPMDAASGGLAALLGGAGGGLEARRGPMLEFVTAHEVAHQWWHGIVGSDSRLHPYQDECLAQYSAMLYVEETHGEARAREEAEQQVAASYHMMRLMGRPDGAVDRPVSAFADPLSYSGLVYGKGPYLYRALRQRLGDRRFFAAISGYVSEHRFGTAPSRALLDRMATGPRAAEVRAMERRWLDEAHGDTDLGAPDLGRMLGGAGGAPGGAGAPSEADLRALLQMLGGGGAGGSGGADGLRSLLEALGGAGGAGGAGDADTQRMLQGLLESLGQ